MLAKCNSGRQLMLEETFKNIRSNKNCTCNIKLVSLMFFFFMAVLKDFTLFGIRKREMADSVAVVNHLQCHCVVRLSTPPPQLKKMIKKEKTRSWRSQPAAVYQCLHRWRAEPTLPDYFLSFVKYSPTRAASRPNLNHVELAPRGHDGQIKAKPQPDKMRSTSQPTSHKKEQWLIIDQ